MHFASDNAGPVHSRVMEALATANEGHALAYGGDGLTARAKERIRDVFEAPRAEVFLAASGTAANAILLASLTRPWGTVFAAETAHIHEDECGATEFMTGGAKITLVRGEHGKLDVGALADAIAGLGGRGVHGVAPGPVSLTNVTERGTLYTAREIAGIAAVARAAGVPLHMDGARFANAVAALGCTPAEITWQAGVEALSLGATKNGCLAAEALVVFDPALAGEVERRRMRAGHLLSKHRFLAAQFLAWFEDGLWLDLAARANAAAARLARGLRERPEIAFCHEPQANMLFIDMPRAIHRHLIARGAVYNLWSGRLDGDDDDEVLTARLVCGWSTTDAEIDAFLDLF